MTAQTLVVVGGGEHARVVLDAVASLGDAWKVAGYVDLAPNEPMTERFGIPFLGTDDEYLSRFEPRQEIRFILGLGGIGVTRGRSRLAQLYGDRGARFASITHARAWVSSSATVEDGVVVLAGAIVNTGARLGAHAIVNTSAVIEHDVQLGPHATVAPGAVIGGGAWIGPATYVGLGARVRDHVVVGRDTVIGMGAVVVGAVGDAQVVVGVPARPKRQRALS